MRRRLELFQKNLHIHLEVARDIIGFYGTRNRARQRFKLIQNKQRFMSQIVNELVPDPETIVALGNAKFATTIKSLGSTPIAKIVKVLADNRRVVIVPEVNTTKRCSYCQTKKIQNKHTKKKNAKIVRKINAKIVGKIMEIPLQNSIEKRFTGCVIARNALSL